MVNYCVRRPGRRPFHANFTDPAIDDMVAIFHEGSEIVEVFARQGTTVAVLKYRLRNPETSTHPEQVPLSDVRQDANNSNFNRQYN